MPDADVEGQILLGELPDPGDELRVNDCSGWKVVQQAAHADYQRLGGQLLEVRLASKAVVNGRIGDDPTYEPTGDGNDPPHLRKGLIIPAISLDEDCANQIVRTLIDVLRTEATAQREPILEPCIVVLGGVPEMEVCVKNGMHQRTTRAEPPRITRRTSARVAIEVSPGVVIASAPCATA